MGCFHSLGYHLSLAVSLEYLIDDPIAKFLGYFLNEVGPLVASYRITSRPPARVVNPTFQPKKMAIACPLQRNCIHGSQIVEEFVKLKEN